MTKRYVVRSVKIDGIMRGTELQVTYKLTEVGFPPSGCTNLDIDFTVFVNRNDEIHKPNDILVISVQKEN